MAADPPRDPFWNPKWLPFGSPNPKKISKRTVKSDFRGPEGRTRREKEGTPKWSLFWNPEKHGRISEKSSPGLRTFVTRGRRAVDAGPARGQPGDFGNQGPPGEVRRGRGPSRKREKSYHTLSQHALGQRPGEFTCICIRICTVRSSQQP